MHFESRWDISAAHLKIYGKNEVSASGCPHILSNTYTNPVYVKESHRCAAGTKHAPEWFCVKLAAESVNALEVVEGESRTWGYRLDPYVAGADVSRYRTYTTEGGLGGVAVEVLGPGCVAGFASFARTVDDNYTVAGGCFVREVVKEELMKEGN